MKTLLAVIVALAFAAPAQAISYPNSTEAPQLEAKLPTTVSVFCTQNTTYNFALIQDRAVYLSTQTCGGLAGSGPLSFARSAEVLYHEWWHVAFQETSEQRTECGAWSMLRYALRHYWGLSKAVAQDDYRQATSWSPYSPLPCVPTTVDPIQL